MQTVIIGKNSGFCFGVKRAVNTALEMADKNVCVLGKLIHNDNVIFDLEKKGVYTINSIEEANNRTVIIRTHGEAKAVFEKAEKLGINVIDCTCPFVKDIQNKVVEFYQKGYKIVIVGKADHPEIIGINGWIDNSALITENPDDVINLSEKKICVVVQTTYSNEKFDNFVKKIESLSNKKLEIFKTICYTTIRRQAETEDLSKNCDAIVVIGGKESSNTDKLFELAKKHQKNVFRIYDPQVFDTNKLKKYRKVGIVCGASTPIEQAQKVIHTMSVTEVNEVENKEEKVEVVEKVVKDPYTMESAMKKLDKKPENFKVGKILTVKISLAGDDGLHVYIPRTKAEILLDKDEMILPYNKADYADKLDTDIRVMVTSLKPVKLSEKAMVKILKEEADVKEIAEGKVFEATVTETNKGGLIAKYGNYQVFIPSSQIRIGFVKDLNKYVGNTLRLKAEKVEMRRRQIVASQRVILEAEKAERDAIKAEKLDAFFNSIEVGDVVTGTPVRFAEFGAFVQVNGFDCLAHVSDLSWSNCNNPAEVLELNKEYQFKVLKVDADKQKVSIGYKQLQPKPWELVEEKYKVGDVINGKVVRLVSFGAFVEVEKGIDGLVHVSQIANKRIQEPSEVLSVGQEVEAKIVAIDAEKEKMNLSIKALLPEEPKPEVKKEKVEKEEVSAEPELKEWIDDNTGSISIAEMMGKIED